ncbi:uncharacterized protein LOC126902074 [Daktulosphaira vitifoliae]|uniref:uncharacterized protein LOC126902074 n=1 Tax=Daktulosphaira vitifoliae TaxID=58002 RepID=UPI0021AACB22|nr:uncharacterized protein LOC126902074 [Daktulosphaira vitifoliae]
MQDPSTPTLLLPPAPPSSTLRPLIRRRASTKASISFIQKLVERYDPAVHSLRQIKTRLNSLQEHWSTFIETHNEISDLEQGFKEENEYLLLEDQICTLKATMVDLLDKSAVTEVISTSNSTQASHIESMRLPAIDLPKFSGDLRDWPDFINTFNALFHDNLKITDVQRFHYLKSSLTGTASDVIKNYSITSANYQEAYSELVRQYENKGLTIQTHIRALLHSPKVHQASAVELRKLHHHIASHVRALKALEQPVQH